MTKDKQTNTAQTNHALPQGWREVRLGEVVDFISDKIEIDCVTKENYVSTDNLLPNRRGVIIASSLPKTKKVNRFKKGDVLFSNIRTYFKKVWFAKFSGGSSNDVIIFRSKDNEVTAQKFLYYLISSDDFIDFTVKSSKGTKMPRGDKKAMKTYKILLPPLPTQKAIAKVLSAFDDKIELLREQNETLEQIGQTLFKEWFGKYSPSRPDDLPEGWRVGKLGEVIETFLGGTPSRSKKEYWTNGTIPWINSGKVNDFRITEGSEMITQEAVENSSTKLLPKGTVVLAITGATLGQYSRLEIDACFNQSVVGLKENEKFKSSYIYFWVANNISHIIKHASGGAHQHINKENINQTDFIIPTEEYLNEYYKMADVIMEKISNNVFQIQTLTQTRDTLLPKLMKGEVLV